jgi:hypothetical protein
MINDDFFGGQLKNLELDFNILKINLIFLFEFLALENLNFIGNLKNVVKIINSFRTIFKNKSLKIQKKSQYLAKSP